MGPIGQLPQDFRLVMKPELSDSTTKSPPYRWVVIMLWMTGHVWGYVLLGSLGFLLPSIRADLGLSPIEEG